MIPNSMPVFNFGLGETADALRETVSAFTADKIAPLADEIDRTDEFPRQSWTEMGALGLHGITVEEDYGGSGLGYLEHCIAMEEVSRGSASVRSVLQYAFEPVCELKKLATIRNLVEQRV